MKKITKEKVEQINAFWESNKNLEQIICDELKSRKIKSIKCMSLGRLNYEFGDTNTNNTVYLAIGFKKNNSVDWRDNKEESLYAIGFNGHDYIFDKKSGKYKDVYKRIITPFNELPIFAQIAIFQTAFSEYEYPQNYNFVYEDFFKCCYCKDFNKLPPCFDKCFFADEKNNLHEITFSNEWDENGCYIFKITSESGERKGKKVILYEDDMMKIIKGGVSQWGFDYALSLDKEKLKELCMGGFKNDYTV